MNRIVRRAPRAIAPDPLVLLCYDNNPGRIAPPRFSSRQVTVCRHYSKLAQFVEPDVLPDYIMPEGTFDLSGLPAGQMFDYVIVFCSRWGALPHGLEVGSAKKIMMLSDTHHGPNSVGDIVRCARDEGFHGVCSLYNRGELHWFAELGLSVGWFPGLLVKSIAVPWHQVRKPQLLFCGQSGNQHPTRRRQLKYLSDNHVPVVARGATNLRSRELYASYQITFNSSLNGDLNLRIFEATCSGGTLLTDRLAQTAGLHLLYEPGRDYDEFGDDAELLEKAGRLLADPRASLDMGHLARKRYWSDHRQDKRITEFMKWVRSDETPSDLPPVDAARLRIGQNFLASQQARLALYHRAQNIHAQYGKVIARGGEKSALAALIDLCDLPGAEIVVPPSDLERLDFRGIETMKARISSRAINGDDEKYLLEYAL